MSRLFRFWNSFAEHGIKIDEKVLSQGGWMYREYEEIGFTAEEFRDLEINIMELREQAEANQRDLDSRYYQRDFSRIHSSRAEGAEENSGSFFFRTALCLLIFCGFLWLKKENRSILGVAPEAVQEVISQTVVIRELAEQK